MEKAKAYDLCLTYNVEAFLEVPYNKILALEWIKFLIQRYI